MAEQTRAGTFDSSPSTSQRTTSSGGESLVGRVRDRATEQLNTQKNKATDGLGSVAHAVRETTGRLRQENHDTVARYVEQAADQIEKFSSRLKDKDIGELVNDAQRLARRQPALFVGGAFAVGLLGARFLKSSGSREDYEHSESFARSGFGSSASASNPATNAYGNRVPAAAGTGSTRARSTSVSRGSDYTPTEGM